MSSVAEKSGCWGGTGVIGLPEMGLSSQSTALVWRMMTSRVVSGSPTLTFDTQTICTLSV